MKKYLTIVFFAVIALCFFKTVRAEQENELSIIKHSKSALLIEAESGKILYKQNENQRLYPASMTKIATMSLVMEALKSGLIKLDTPVTTSKYAASIPGSTILLGENEVMMVNDLLKGVAIASGNDAATALAEKIGGSEKIFVNMMNDLVKELKLVNTTFKNPTGLNDREHFSTAYDMAMLARNLVVNYPEILKYTKIYEDWLRKDSKSPFWLVNTNKLVRHYEGVDGLKTGWTEEAGYCLTATIERDGMRLIAVVMGGESASLRDEDVKALIEYGFTNFERKLVAEKDMVVADFNNIKYTKEKINIITDKDIYIVKKKMEELKAIEYKAVIDYDKIHGLNQNDIGTLEVYYDNKLQEKISLRLEKPIKKNNVFEITLILFKKLFS